MKQSGANQERSQAENRELVLRTLQHIKLCSRAELAKQTGLKQATITHMMNDFLAWGLVDETGLLPGSKGRRSIGVQISESNFRVIGFRLTRQYFTIGVFTMSCRETGSRIQEEIRNSDPEYILEKVCGIINQIIRSRPREQFLAVGVSVPGPYYQDEGEIAMISAFPGWCNIKIREIMQKRIPLPVIVDHDANAGALAESSLVPERNMYDTMVYVSAGQGIGAGIVEEGKIYRGALGIAGEIGHTCVDVNGALCECGGHGCLTLYASTIALTDNVRRRMHNPELTMTDIVRLIHEEVPEVLEEFQRLMRYLSAGIVNLIYTYNPSRIVIGDALSEIGQPILDSLHEHLKTLTVRRLADQLKIELAELGYDSAYVGAAEIATRYVFSNVGLIAGEQKARDAV